MGKTGSHDAAQVKYCNDPKFSDRFVKAKWQTQIRLLLEEQSDQGLHCLLFHLHVFDKTPSGFASLFEFQQNFLASENLGTLR